MPFLEVEAVPERSDKVVCLLLVRVKMPSGTALYLTLVRSQLELWLIFSTRHRILARV